MNTPWVGCGRGVVGIMRHRRLLVGRSSNGVRCAPVPEASNRAGFALRRTGKADAILRPKGYYVTLYSVFARQDRTPSAVADRFSWFAALLPPVNALAHGLWLLLAGWVLAVAAVVALDWLAAATCVLGLRPRSHASRLRGRGLRRRALRHRGFQHAGDFFATEPDLAIVEALKRK